MGNGRPLMFKGATLFGVVFAFIAPKTRAVIFDIFDKASDGISTNAPYSYVVLGVLSGLLLISILMIKTWPERSDPASPMSRYRHQDHFDN